MSMLTGRFWRCLATMAGVTALSAAGIGTASSQSTPNSNPDPGSAKTVAAVPAEASATSSSTAVASGSPSGTAAEILKLLEAGVSPDVIKVYIENKTTGFVVTADDLVMLKRRGVSDDISLALVKRGTGAKEGAGAPAKPTQVVIAAPSNGAHLAYGGVDPESYDYFRLYYLHPRALAAAYQRLGYFGTPLGYGYSRPWAYGPGFAPALGPWGYNGYGLR